MEHLLISNARHLRQANGFGVKKILRNIVALQQSIKTITNDHKNTAFERAKRYYSLFFMLPQVGSKSTMEEHNSEGHYSRICWTVFEKSSCSALTNTRPCLTFSVVSAVARENQVRHRPVIATTACMSLICTGWSWRVPVIHRNLNICGEHTAIYYHFHLVSPWCLFFCDCLTGWGCRLSASWIHNESVSSTGGRRLAPYRIRGDIAFGASVTLYWLI